MPCDNQGFTSTVSFNPHSDTMSQGILLLVYGKEKVGML